MAEVELIRLHEDGERVVLAGKDGVQMTLRITEELRAAVRRDRPRLEHLRAEGASSLSPREIQSRLRSGATLEDVAELAGVSMDQIRKFAGPVLAEREFVIGRARAWESRANGGPTLDDLVAQRLPARGVEPESIDWSATRDGTSPWTVTAAFDIDGHTKTAQWSYDMATRTLHALDDEARWLSQTDLEQTPHPGRTAFFDAEAASPRLAAVADRPLFGANPLIPEDDPVEETVELLDDLSHRRGLRPGPGADEPDDVVSGDEFSQAGFDLSTLSTPVWPRVGATPVQDDGATVVELPDRSRREGPNRARSTHPSAALTGGSDRNGKKERGRTTRRTPTSQTPAPPPEPADEPEPENPAPAPGTRKPNRRTRAKVPSLDDIVFGVKPRE